MIRAAIIEDEPLAARYLRSLLEQTGRVEVVGIAGDALSGLRLCAWEKPEAAFVDIRLPGQDGVRLAADLATVPRPPVVVFTTGYADRAPDAFDLGAVHYLMKPLLFAKVVEAVNRIEMRLAHADTDSCAPVSPSSGISTPTLERLTIRSGNDDITRLLRIEQVVAAMCRRRRTWIHTSSEEFSTYYRLNWLQQHGLSQPLFIKISRDTIVNLQAVEEVIHSGDREYSLRLRDRLRTRVAVSRSCARQIADLMSLQRSPLLAADAGG